MKADSPKVELPQQKKEAKPFSVLIVDDEEFILAFVGIKLRMSGYEVMVAHDGAQALESVKKTCPDLVVMDLIMPRMDGIQLVKELRKFSDVPVLVLSAIESTENAVKDIRDKTDDFIQKPFDPDDLVARIETIRKRRQAHGHSS
jgi:two-component system, OmpR family, response regulator RpaB